MKITKVETFPVNIPFTIKYLSAETLRYAYAPGRPITGRVIVKVHTDEEVVGLGESMPFPFYKEPAETVVTTIDKYFSKVLVGVDPFDIEKNMEEMDKVMPEQPSTKNAIVTALYDIIGKKLNVPIYKLIGGFCREKMPIAHCMGFGSPEEKAAEAVEWIKRGVNAFKIKIGRPGRDGPTQDLKVVEAIRNAVGPNASLRVDANETYTLKVNTLREMENYDLDLIEQPAPRRDLAGMRRICQALDTPVLADQSIFDIKDAVVVIENEAADVIMVKNYVVGGFYRTKQLLGILEATHTASYLEGGTETGIGTAATLQLAASTAKVDYWGCLNGPFHLSNDLIKEPLRFDNGCWMVPKKPGLGVELDEEKLKLVMIERG